MAEKLFKVVQLDDGSITVDAPASEFPEKGYFTFYDKSASARGECEPMRRHRRDTARVSGRQERPAILLAMMPGALPGASRSGYARDVARRAARRPSQRLRSTGGGAGARRGPGLYAARLPCWRESSRGCRAGERESSRAACRTLPRHAACRPIGGFSARSAYTLRARLLLFGVAGVKGHSFHKFTERHPYTKEHFSVRIGRGRADAASWCPL